MSDELTDAQIVELEQALRALARELEAGLDANSDSADVVDLDQPIGRVSRIDAIQQQKIAKANKARAAVRLERVKAALTDVRTGDYGLCKSCEEDIGYARLAARPESAFCLGCQRQFEQQRARR